MARRGQSPIPFFAGHKTSVLNMRLRRVGRNVGMVHDIKLLPRLFLLDMKLPKKSGILLCLGQQFQAPLGPSAIHKHCNPLGLLATEQGFGFVRRCEFSVVEFNAVDSQPSLRSQSEQRQ